MADIHVNDIGTELVVVVKDEDEAVVDVSGATKTIKLTKPDGVDVPKSAVNDTTGTDGKIRYNTIANDLDQPGLWQIQGFVEMASGQKWHTKVGSFRVKPNLS